MPERSEERHFSIHKRDMVVCGGLLIIAHGNTWFLLAIYSDSLQKFWVQNENRYRVIHVAHGKWKYEITNNLIVDGGLGAK
jgi:hypothetical protein